MGAQGEFEEARAIMQKMSAENKLVRTILAQGRSLFGKLQEAMPTEDSHLPKVSKAYQLTCLIYDFIEFHNELPLHYVQEVTLCFVSVWHLLDRWSVIIGSQLLRAILQCLGTGGHDRLGRIYWGGEEET